MLRIGWRVFKRLCPAGVVAVALIGTTSLSAQQVEQGLWAVTPEGRTNNLGSIQVDGDKGSLNASTVLYSFALIVTAEPHFAVSIPTQYIVLQNIAGNVQGTELTITSLAERADYTALKPIADDPKRHLPAEPIMARYAASIANAAQTAQWAPEALRRATEALAFSTDRERVSELAREAVARRRVALVSHLTSELEVGTQQIQSLQSALDNARRESVAVDAQWRLKLDQCEQRLPSPSSRLQMASQLLGRWLVMDADETAIVAHIANDGFAKGHTELTQSHDRLATAAGILNGAGVDLLIGSDAANDADSKS